MKEGWRMVKLGEVCDICLGLTHTPKYVDKGIPFVSVKDISQGELNLNNTKRISKDEFTNMPDGAKPRKGDVLFCRVGTIGKPQVLKLDEPFGIFVSVGFLRTKTNSLNTFLRHWMDSNLFMSQVEKNVQGSTLKNLNTGWLKNFTLPLPPLEEQHRIVSILDASFEKIDALKKNAEENLKNAKALFQQVLAQELKPKEGWVEKKLGEICSKIGSGATPHGGKESYKEEGVSLIRSLNVYDNEFIYDDLAHIDDKQADELNNVIIEKNDVLFNITGASVTRCCIVPNKILPARVNQHVSILRPQNGVLTNVFLCYLMISMKDYLIKLAFSKGATRQAITKKQLEDLMIAYPNDINEQMSIVNTINTLSEKCRRLEQVAQQTIRECDALKQSILRQAFSGEL